MMAAAHTSLEYAAKACGIQQHPDGGCEHLFFVGGDYVEWNPLTNSADCATMCAVLEIDTMWFASQVECDAHPTQDNAFASIFSQFGNKEEAWRYAATMVAAKLGGMK